jgi:hypothetical protein
MGTREVELDVPEPVDVEDSRTDPVLADVGLGKVELRERVDCQGRPELLD